MLTSVLRPPYRTAAKPSVVKPQHFSGSDSRGPRLCGSMNRPFVVGELSMRWILLVLALVGFGLAFSAKTPGLLGFGLLIGLGALLGALFGFAAARIASTARPDAVLLTDRDINILRTSMRKPAPTPPSAQPTQSA